MSGLTLISQEGGRRNISREAAKAALVLAEMLQDDDDEGVPAEMPLPDMDTFSMNKIADFLEMYAQDPFPEYEGTINGPDLGEIFPGVLARYVSFAKSLDLQHLVDVTNAANYIDCFPLLHLLTLHISCMIYGKEPRKIWELIGVDPNGTLEELDAIEKENQWVFDIPQPKVS
jgi:hypothetical protein